MSVSGCIFCRIIRGEVPAMKVFEDDHTLVFMDIAGDADGHMLAVPKAHVKNVLDCDVRTLHRLMDTVQRVSRHLTENCGYDGINLLNASDESAGQSVPHFHIHIIPRKANDGVDAWPALPGAADPLEETYARLRIPGASK